jgi:hypothetical protein
VPSPPVEQDATAHNATLVALGSRSVAVRVGTSAAELGRFAAVALSDVDIGFLADHQSAAMITVSTAGVAKPSRVSLGLVDGKLWSSGTQNRVRTARLRRDPRCTLFVFDAESTWRGLETTVTILDGPDAAELNLRLFRTIFATPSGPINWFGRDFNDEEFLQAMVDQERLVYEFEVHRSYGTA